MKEFTIFTHSDGFKTLKQSNGKEIHYHPDTISEMNIYIAILQKRGWNKVNLV